MKSSKLAIILASLVILIMCLSVVSAAVENSSNNYDINDTVSKTNVGLNDVNDTVSKTNVGLNDVNDSSPVAVGGGLPLKLATVLKIDDQLGDDTYISLKELNSSKPISGADVKCELKKDGKVVKSETINTDASGEVKFSYKYTPGKYTLTCTYEGNDTYKASNDSHTWKELIPTHFEVDVEPFGDKVLSGQLKDINANTLKNTRISVSLYDAKGNFIKDTPMITDDIGVANYDISKLPKGKYKAIFRFDGNDKYYSTTSEKISFTVEGKDPIHKKEKKDPKDVDMENTGAPIIALALGLLAVAGIGYRRF